MDGGLERWIPPDRVSLYEKLEDRVRAAFERARGLGRIVGRVARYEPIGVEPGQSIVVEVSPEVYYSRPGPYWRVGDYLAIVDLKGEAVVLARVSAVERRDLLSYLGAQAPADPLVWEPDPASLLTQTILRVEPVLEVRLGGGEPSGEPVPAVSSIEPQSPVVEPRPEVLRSLLGLPEEGLLLGALATPAGLAADGRVPVVLPYKSLLQHTLIIGTTGAGKTTLLKNMAAYLASKGGERAPTPIFVDMNQDFVQLLFPPLDSAGLAQDAVYRSLLSRVEPPRSLVVVAPVTRRVIVEALDPESGGWCDIASRIAGIYLAEVVQPLLDASGYEVEGGKDWSRDGTCIVSYTLRGAGPARRLHFIPYTVNTLGDDSDRVATLLHGLTPLAKDFFRRGRERFHSKTGAYPPLPVVAAALRAYAEYLNLPKQARSDYDPGETLSSMLSSAVAARIGGEAAAIGGSGGLLEQAQEYYSILSDLLPHRGTVEALYRRVSSLLDTGIVDVAYALPESGGPRLEFAPEPSWPSIVSLAGEERAPVVLDLRWAHDKGLGSIEGPRLAAYRMLDRLRSWRQEEWRKRKTITRPILVVIDEAHQFFPQEKGLQEEREASRQVAGMIASIARLGRARGIGLVFATHSPRDLHDIILQLANTKILLRTEKAQAEALNIPSDAREILPRLPDRFMVVLSHAFREGYIMAATSPPVTMHYDVSAGL